jgi:hypothetical protein
MKKHPTKIILNLFFTILVTACHTLDHKGFKLNPTNKNIVQIEIESKKNSNYNIGTSSERIILPKKIKEKSTKKLDEPSKLLSIKKLKKTKPKIFNPISMLKLSESKLFTTLGKSDFVKFEGKLKNHQYYFSKCFLDVFVIKKRNVFYVDFVQIRSIKLNGMLDEDECLQDINKKFNILKR